MCEYIKFYDRNGLFCGPRGIRKVSYIEATLPILEALAATRALSAVRIVMRL